MTAAKILALLGAPAKIPTTKNWFAVEGAKPQVQKSPT